MLINRLLCSVVLAAGLAGAGPAMAGEPVMAGASYTHSHEPNNSAPTWAPAMAGPSREAWLAECRGRSAPVEIDDGWDDRPHHRRHGNRQGRGPSTTGPDACEAYLIDYEAWAATVSAGYARQAAYATAVPTTGGCCRPRAGCGETVEYVEEYVPARPRLRDKRIRIVPDKRVRVR